MCLRLLSCSVNCYWCVFDWFVCPWLALVISFHYFRVVPMLASLLCTDEQDALKVNFTLAALEAKAPFANQVRA